MNKNTISKARTIPGFNEWETDYYDLGNKSLERRKAFLRTTQICACSVFAVLISLHPTIPALLCIRILFACSIVLLALGILLLGISLYRLSRISARMHQACYNELVYVLEGKGYDRDKIRVNEKMLQKLLEKIAYAFIFLSLISLTVYTILRTFN